MDVRTNDSRLGVRTSRLSDAIRHVSHHQALPESCCQGYIRGGWWVFSKESAPYVDTRDGKRPHRIVALTRRP